MKFIGILSLILVFTGCNQTGTIIEQEEIPVEYIKLTPEDFRTRIAGPPIAYLPLGTL